MTSDTPAPGQVPRNRPKPVPFRWQPKGTSNRQGKQLANLIRQNGSRKAPPFQEQGKARASQDAITERRRRQCGDCQESHHKGDRHSLAAAAE